MKFAIALILFIIIAYVLSLFLPWWNIVIIATIWGLIFNFKPPMSFSLGFLGAGLLWGMSALFIYMNGGEIIANRIGTLLGNNSGITLLLGGALLAALLGGMGALSGKLARDLFYS